MYTTSAGAPPYQSLETQAWVYVFDGSGNNCSFPLNPGTGYTCLTPRSAVTRAYDNYNPTTQQWNAGYGNVVSETIYGNYDLPGDEVTLTY